MSINGLTKSPDALVYMRTQNCLRRLSGGGKISGRAFQDRGAAGEGEAEDLRRREAAGGDEAATHGNRRRERPCHAEHAQETPRQHQAQVLLGRR